MSWWKRLFSGRRLEAQLDKELRFHVDQHAADLMARGHSAEEARRLARIALGGADQVKEACRDARGTRWIEDMWRDVRYALRTLRQKPGFAAVALVTLALGCGATTIMFTVIDGVLLKPLPYFEPHRLARIHGFSETWNAGLYGDQNVSYPDFVDCRRESKAFAMAGWMGNTATLSEPGEAQRVDEADISSNMFSLLGVRLAAGREFTPDEDRKGGAPAAILGYDLWQRRFGGSAAAIGTALVLDGKRYTIAGIAPAGFRIAGEELDVFTPLGQNGSSLLERRGPHPTGVLARLRPGFSLQQGQTELALIGRRLAAQYPATNQGRTFIARELRPNTGDARGTLWLLLGAVSLVLSIACANIASLLLARAVSRERELAMRAALGASRSRLARQCLTESAVLALGGGALGVLLAIFGLKPFVALWPGALPRADEIQLDWRVLAFALAVSLACGLLFGLAPALRVPARTVEQALRAGSTRLTGGSRRLQGAFVAAEIALAMVLLVSAGMLGRTLVHLSSLDPGVNVHNVLTARAALSPATLADPGRTRAAWNDLLDRARRVPGVEAVAMVDTVPMRPGSNPIGYRTSAAPVPENRQPIVLANSVSPDYLKVTGLQLVEGRFLEESDRSGTQSVAVIDDVMARQAFGNEDPIGRHVWIDLGADPTTVVGVVRHVRYWGLGGDDQAQVRAQLYYPFAQVPDRLVRRWSELMSIAMRTRVDPLSLVEPVGRAIHGVGNDQVLYQVRTLEQLAKASIARQRFLLILFSVFAGIALVLACVGIYGVLAYLTSQRIPEIGVRMALGASASEVMWMVLRQSLAMIAAGAVAGLVAAWAAGRVLERSVEGMQPLEPLTFALTIAILAAAAVAASFVPARRASRIDPMSALRN